MRAMSEKLEQMLGAHITNFNNFKLDFDEHKSDVKQVITKVDAVHTNSVAFAQNVAHLSNLPQIASSLKALEQHTAKQVTDLISQGSASELGKTKLIERMLMMCLVVVVFLGIVLIITFVKEGDHDLKISSDGIEMNRHSIQQQQEKKTE